MTSDKNIEIEWDVALHDSGENIYNAIKHLFPIHRHLLGEGVRQTLNYFKKQIPDLTLESAKSGTRAFDWVIPPEWILKDASITNQNGIKILDISKNNLHILQYSNSISAKLPLEKLLENIHTLPDTPDAIPYRTNYYGNEWGFCMSERDKKALDEGLYDVNIQAEFVPGQLDYGELVIKGKTTQEIVFTSYVCHPSMANNELSGPCLLLEIFKFLNMNKNKLHYTYRLLLLPETIGSIYYISKNIDRLKQNVFAGFVVTCIGDDGPFSIMEPRSETNVAFNAATKAFKQTGVQQKLFDWSERGSDERQFCSPLVNLPFTTISRSKFGEYEEYHTSLDNLDFISPDALAQSYEKVIDIIKYFETSYFPQCTIMCEPFMSKYDGNLYPSINTQKTRENVANIMDFISYCDGQHTFEDIALLIGSDEIAAKTLVRKLVDLGIVNPPLQDGYFSHMREASLAH